MPANPIDEYLATLSESQRAALSALRVKILKVVPSAEECITYGVPTFKVDGTSVAGFAAYKNHLSYLPMSGSVLSDASLADDLKGYEMSKGAMKFTADNPPSQALVKKLITVRRAQA